MATCRKVCCTVAEAGWQPEEAVMVGKLADGSTWEKFGSGQTQT
jgi:hypothetical protein